MKTNKTCADRRANKNDLIGHLYLPTKSGKCFQCIYCKKKKPIKFYKGQLTWEAIVERNKQANAKVSG